MSLTTSTTDHRRLAYPFPLPLNALSLDHSPNSNHEAAAEWRDVEDQALLDLRTILADDLINHEAPDDLSASEIQALLDRRTMTSRLRAQAAKVASFLVANSDRPGCSADLEQRLSSLSLNDAAVLGWVTNIAANYDIGGMLHDPLALRGMAMRQVLTALAITTKDATSGIRRHG